jgi:hypothetical protein
MLYYKSRVVSALFVYHPRLEPFFLLVRDTLEFGFFCLVALPRGT